MRFFILSLLFITLFANSAEAAYYCDDQGFSLETDADGVTTLNASFEVGTPGFSYALEQPDTEHINITLTPPDGMVIQVITLMEITHALETPPAETLTIALTNAHGGWPEKTVTCGPNPPVTPAVKENTPETPPSSGTPIEPVTE